MAKDNKKLVQAIPSQEENFAQWYTDICVKAELVEYSSVKGFIILRPYGQAIWELIQKDLDARFKATGHENVAMPVLMPESLLKKEGELSMASRRRWRGSRWAVPKSWKNVWQSAPPARPCSAITGPVCCTATASFP